MLGWGPIGAGYSILATVEHQPSMFDLPAPELDELDRFSAEIRQRLLADFGPAVITEHGRVAPCVAAPTRAYEPHCLHAHRLIFCGHGRLEVRDFAPAFDWRTFDSLVAAQAADDGGQYLCCEQADSTVELAPVRGPLPRQFFRRLMAAAVGRPELADWRRHRGQETIMAARRILTNHT
jgi:hypothetical protein